jgi:hypothetical protein
VNQVIWGASAALSVVAAVFFLKFWRRTRDGLFAAFAAGFAALALHWGALGVVNPGSETRHYLYVVRFVAFALFIAGIVDKNRRSAPPAPPAPGLGASPPRPPGTAVPRRK